MTNREAAPPPAPYRSLSVWAVSAGGWLILGALNSGSELIDLLTGNSSARAWEPIVWEYSSALAFAVLTPFVISFALRVRFRSHSRLVALASHGLAALAFSWLHVALMVGTRKLVYTAVGRSYEFGRLGLELLYEGFKDVVESASLPPHGLRRVSARRNCDRWSSKSSHTSCSTRST
jgi:hypothetical protein